MSNYTIKEEIWKDIKDYEGLYMISNLGNVKSLDKMSKNNRGPYLKKGRILKQSKRNDYPFVTITNKIDGKAQSKSRSIHRMVAIAFIENPENKPQVNHIDGNKSNNKISNLEWCTALENNKHAQITGLIGPSTRSRKVKQYLKNGEFITSYDSITSAAVENGIWASNIHKAVNGTINTTGGYVWRYA